MRKQKNNRGITLIALVITIIVLLILATVSIATLTGENGILTKATTAKDKTIEAEEKEQINLAYTTVMMDKLHSNKGNDLTVSAEELGEELDNQNAGAKVVEAEKIGELTVTFTKSKNVYTVDGGTGKITDSGNSGGQMPTEPEKSELEKAKEEQSTFEIKTEIRDIFGNKVVVPEGFKIAKDSADDVTGGVVIEDVTHGETAGSQFVWIPVGEIRCEEGSKKIELSRYTFESDGKYNKQDNKQISQEGKYFNEFATSSADNSTAINIENFKISASIDKNSGYYIGRYEAGDIKATRERSSNTVSQTNPMICKKAQYSYRYITQPNASTLARKMYVGKKITSDLMNSYAWDTAIIFIQEFSGDIDYCMQSRLQSTIAKTGEATDGTNNDVRCNIYDMAGNCYEWTTETNASSSTSLTNTATMRGGSYNLDNRYPSFRGGVTKAASFHTAFRPILYLDF